MRYSVPQRPGGHHQFITGRLSVAPCDGEVVARSRRQNRCSKLIQFPAPRAQVGCPTRRVEYVGPLIECAETTADMCK